MAVATTTWEPTTEDILNLDGVHRRQDSFRFELCNRDLVPIGELHPDRTGAVPSISNDSSSNSSRRLQNLKLVADEANDIDTLSDRLRVYLVLQNGVEYRLGTFLWGDDSRPERSWGPESHGSLVDFTHILNQRSTRAYGWGRGANLMLNIFFLIGQAGFEFADIAVIGEEAARSINEPMSWAPGATWLQMLTDFGNLVGFAPPWFDRDGRVHVDQPPDPEISPSGIPAYGPGTRVIADSVVFSNDLLSAPNDFAVTDSGTSNLRTGRYQLPASAPHSFANRGFRVGLVETVQGLATQAQADKAAKNLARTKNVAYEWLTFSSTADPRHDSYEVVDAFGERWLETAWSLELKSGGLMKHTLRRTSYAVT